MLEWTPVLGVRERSCRFRHDPPHNSELFTQSGKLAPPRTGSSIFRPFNSYDSAPFESWKYQEDSGNDTPNITHKPLFKSNPERLSNRTYITRAGSLASQKRLFCPVLVILLFLLPNISLLITYFLSLRNR